ncbi:MAG: hypothetical protein BWY56_01392 [Acidobacteria bacterium ADurb.Bin340]|nr:MAG: hypothetical protein BWY56_01392 [Acidobacteria bacterium ADurb.Bin340]
MAVLVEHGAHAAVAAAGQHDVALLQGARLHQHGGHGAAAAVQLGLQDAAGGGAIRHGLEFLEIRHEQHRFQQLVQALLRLGRHGHAGHAAAEGLGLDPVLEQHLLHPVGIGLGLVDLVDGHHHRHIGGLGVVDGLDGLGHHAVIGRHHEDDDVRDLGAPGAHLGEGFVARRVDEDHLAHVAGVGILHVHVVGADGLGDAAGLAGRHLGGSDRVQQRGLAVVHVAHDGDHGAAGHLVAHGLAGVLGGELDILLEGDDVRQVAELPGDVLGQFGIQGLVDGGHDPPVQQLGHHVLGRAVALLGKLLHRDAFGEHHDADFLLHVLRGDLLGLGPGLAQPLGQLLLLGTLVLALLLATAGTAAGTLAAVGRDGPRGAWGSAGAAGPSGARTHAGTPGTAGSPPRTTRPPARAARAASRTSGASAAGATTRPSALGRTGLGQLNVAGRLLRPRGRSRGVGHLDLGEALVRLELGEPREGRDAPRSCGGRGLGDGLLRLDFALAGVAGHGQGGPLRLRHARPLNGGLPGALHYGLGAGLGPGTAALSLLGQLDVAGGLLGLGRRGRRLGNPQTAEGSRRRHLRGSRLGRRFRGRHRDRLGSLAPGRLRRGGRLGAFGGRGSLHQDRSRGRGCHCFGGGFGAGCRGALDHAHRRRGFVDREGGGFFRPLGLGVEKTAELEDLVVAQVRAVALPGDAHTLFEGLDHVVVRDTDLFGELVDAQHEGADLENGWDRKGQQRLLIPRNVRGLRR